jgi:hypothetical protein
MKSLERIDTTYRLNELPRLKSRSIKYGDKILYTGSIVRRPLKGLAKFYWHYAFIYGLDTKKRLLLIENNEDGVECITWKDFTVGQKWEVFHIEDNPKGFNTIMKRAKEKSKHPYQGAENNCEHFVNYCLFGKEESEQTNNTKKFTDALFSIMEMQLLNTPDSSLALESLDNIRESLKVPRTINKKLSPQLGQRVKEAIERGKKMDNAS